MWLRRNKGDWVTVVRETEINYFWLSKLARGKIPNPGYKNLHTLELYVIKVEKKKKR